MDDYQILKESINNFNDFLKRFSYRSNESNTEFTLNLLKGFDLLQNDDVLELEEIVINLSKIILSNEIKNSKYEICSALYASLFSLHQVKITAKSLIDFFNTIKINKSETFLLTYDNNNGHNTKIFVSKNDDINRLRCSCLIGLIMCFDYGDVDFNNVPDFENFNNFMRNVINELPDMETKKEIYSLWIRTVIKILWRSQGRKYDFISECVKHKYRNMTNRSEILIDKKSVHDFLITVPWTVKMKYHVLVILAKFCLSSVPIFQAFCRKNISDGFYTSLLRPQSLRVGNELFRFILMNIPNSEWKAFLTPIMRRVISSDDMFAKENFCKYWLPFFSTNNPQSINLFFRLMKSNENNYYDRRYSYLILSVLKLCRRDGIILSIMENQETFFEYVTKFFSIDEEIRSNVFTIICNYDKQSILHCRSELRLILCFLLANLNTDYTILRKNVLSSFEIFLLRFRCSTLKILKSSPEEDVENLLKPALRFIKELNGLIISGIEPGSSYQSKIFSLNLYKLVMNYLVFSISDADVRKSNINGQGELFVKFAIKHKKWLFDSDINRTVLWNCIADPHSEIKEIASELLITYFKHTNMYPTAQALFIGSLRLTESIFFYERESAAIKIRTLVSMLYKSNTTEEILDILDISYSGARCVTDFFVNRAGRQINILKKDLWKSALIHQIDCSVEILTYLITNDDSPEYNHPLVSELIEKIICLIEFLVIYLTDALSVGKNMDYAPSFEEMGIALDSIIDKSSVITNNQDNILDFHSDELDKEEDSTSYLLSDKQQLLINYIWVTLKVCSKLASRIIIKKGLILSVGQISKCGNAVVKILRRCRHKGAIEMASVSLKDIVNFLTTHNIHVELLDQWLIEVLDLLKNSSGGCTVSRGSAGHSLLIQNIVASDTRKNKPLLSICWIRLNEILREIDFSKISNDQFEELSETQALHFLKTLVADARIKSNLDAHIEDIAIICLNTMSAPIWTIRNAALQLFGKLLLRLVGQRTSTDLCTNMPYEELFPSMPKFTNYIMKKLKKASEIENLNQLPLQSNIAPILIILKSIVLTSCNYNHSSTWKQIQTMRKYVNRLLGSGIFFIRNLAAKAYVSLHSKEEILSINSNLRIDISKYIGGFKYLQKRQQSYNIISENMLHGYLLTVKYLQFIYPKNNYNNRNQKIIKIDYNGFSLITQSLLFELGFPYITTSMCNYLENFEDNFIYFNSIGLNQITDVILENRIKICLKPYVRRTFNISEILQITKKYLESENYSNHLIKSIFIGLKFRTNLFNQDEVKELFNIFAKYLEKKNFQHDLITTSYFYDLILCTIEKWKFFVWDFDLKFKEIFFILKSPLRLEEISRNDYAKGLRILSGFCWIKHFSKNNVMEEFVQNLINYLLKEIYETILSNYDFDVRFNSGKGLLCLVEILKIINKNNFDGFHFWLIIYELIQDEDGKVRNQGIKCLKEILKDKKEESPETEIYFSSANMCLMQLFQYNTMKKFMSDKYIAQFLVHFLRKFESMLDINKSGNFKQVNPFYGQDNLINSKIPNYFYNLIVDCFMFDSISISYCNLTREKNIKDLKNLTPFDRKYVISKICFFLIALNIKIRERSNADRNSLSDILNELEIKFNFSYYNIDIIRVEDSHNLEKFIFENYL